jgi:hypothetical protein
MKLDLRGAYNLIWSKEADEYEVASRMRHSQYEYQVMLLGQTNKPAFL